MPVILAQLNGVFVEVLGVLHVWGVLRIARPRVPETHLLQMLRTLELYKDNDGVNLILP